MDTSGKFLTREIADLQTGDDWVESSNLPSGPIRLTAGDQVFSSQSQYQLVDQFQQATQPAGVRQTIVLREMGGAAQFYVTFEVYDDQPVLRYSARYRNLTGARQTVTSVNMLPWTFDDADKRYTALRVDQWSVLTHPADFQTTQSAIDLNGSAFEVLSGAHGQQCGWLAVHDSDGRGLFLGWEFDGRAKATARQVSPDDYLDFSASVLDLSHPVDPMQDFQTPPGFIGLFHGDFDEAGYRTQRFVEAALAKPVPDTKRFPYVSWDSWGYEKQIDEAMLRRNADIAAALGVELFVVDLGWSRAIGDWYADPQKFPSGLGSLSEYVHSLGMKFGLHFALAEADPASPVMMEHPDWSATDNYSYFGALGLCLSNGDTRDWLISEAIRIIDDYKPDWIVQDGENMVKLCTKTTHTHSPDDSNYSNSVDGLNYVVSAIQAARPNVLWENQEDGGNMMTFNMVRSYVTSATNDASGSLEARTAVYGATYPFPPRYAERYMPDQDGVSSYATHSYRFGGNWALMNKLDNLSRDQLGFLASQIASYKDQRADISSGKVYHLRAPGVDATDAIQSYNPDTDNAIAVVTRAESSGPEYLLHPKGLVPNHRYTVRFEIDPRVYSLPGSQIMMNGVRVSLPTPYSSEVVHIEHQ